MPEDKPAPRAPSIYDVARAAGVSHQTVSRVLNDHPSLRAETKKRVLGVMAELDYRPNLAARALVTSRTRTIGVLSSQSLQFGPASSIQAIEVAARDAGYLVVTANVDGTDGDSIQAGIRHLLNQAVEGLVVIAPQIRVFDILSGVALRIPNVTLQTTDAERGDALYVDQMAGARMATAHLIELGHTEIVHLSGPQDWIEAEARMRGYLVELGDRNLPLRPPILGDWSAERGHHVGLELSRLLDVTAVFAANDQMALGVMSAFHERGIRVPEDVSVIGFDDIPEAAYYWPPLTSVRQDFAELGRRCVATLLSLIEGERPEASPPIDPQLMVRGSTAVPRSLAAVVRAAHR
ncbi:MULTISPECIES: LacI family DNA-binding transcriptional regulator [unclassified Rathayibacter]|uniref:LacI family DNA-binding transcriptional regulator n=1 Tax=unclassified Rathayibacter TaxID=2609250 RepID=UPI000F4C8D59|nr:MULTISPECIES: LacI family DNA-binding transcriptional regulator [unclassified Rathayibacter]MCJ1672128.1 LacI family DNA-binding transcriptional regulator [Rathayibacter sp. VKM Ac-2929]MCJ1683513.1 LacI family DNA-binding transcriptional regulator [Rathayibacter sp. VKM Ac-2928]MCJ1686491.1 LacI family DNA-binding transcriptional regulator [Rathayibacter sp. VKM Ac-2927]MCJ1704515.1 LacI family DNA-binding transcriptional regulator [Rathayibacter sp. VKM Ac-2926]ROP45188.1 LacI family tran